MRDADTYGRQSACQHYANIDNGRFKRSSSCVGASGGRFEIVSAPLPPIFLNNDEAAQFVNLSPRTLEKHRVIGGGPRFRKFGRRVVYAQADLEACAIARSCKSTSDPQYLAMRGTERP